ncbi:putative aldouronate transport system permease protein [Paenibacillus sp. 1_12]|uniref:carbohydrate ABC transporter permease n=1 Tax=Paenibacillus sp. 1_12 TaxID=1566278 RepID=UPI0008E6F000|nr:carbohydrate ABC transporter permease [Paenibacillus sp. 1_12]SFL77224.1 putative aldouronate transport system permease protein [Paenibacillus sp. 1_12]
MFRMDTPRKWFVSFNYMFLTLAGIVMLLPFINILAGSFSGGTAILQGRVTVFPVDFTLANYGAVLNNAAMWKSFGVTVYITVLGTLLNLLFTSLMAYGLAKKELKGRSFFILIVLFAMIFPAPLIPSYLIIKYMGMLNTLWALIIPGLIGAFNLIIMISFFQTIPDGLTDAAKIDGCSDYRTYWSIVLPLSLPSLTTIGLFYAVGHWNGYFSAMMYLRDPGLYPMQVKLRQLIVDSDAANVMQSVQMMMQSVEGIKMATIIVATVPVLLIYPMIQKHFIKGAMLGSVKG